MGELLMTVGRMSITASLTALAVLALRWALLRLKAPAFVRLLLWAVVLFRMVCPVSFASPWGAAALLEQAVPAPQTQAEAPAPAETAAILGGMAGVPAISPEEPAPEDVTVNVTPMEPISGPETALSPLAPLSVLWLAGVAALWGWWAITYRHLKRRMAGAEEAEPGVWESELSGPPFVLGFFPPKIYLPRGLGEPERGYVLAHERLHLRRGDFLWKPLFFLAVSVHWFNPVLWLAWRLFCRDLEEACDQGVLRALPPEARTGYARALLALAAPQAGPLPAAFGEHDVSRRVKGALAYKKPAVLAAVVLAAVAVAVGLWLAADASGGAGLPGRPPVLSLSLDVQTGELSAAGWDGEEGPDPAALLADAPLFTDDNAWHHSFSLSFPDGIPYPDDGSCTDYLLIDEEWVAGETRPLSFNGDLEPRDDSQGDGRLEERGVLITYTWREGFEGRSATYAFRLAAPSVREGQYWLEPLIYANGNRLDVYSDGSFPVLVSAIEENSNFDSIPMGGAITINDPTVPHIYSAISIYLMDWDGTVMDQRLVMSSGGEESREREPARARSASGFALNLEEWNWWTDRVCLLGLEVFYRWDDGGEAAFRSVFQAVPVGGDILNTLPADLTGGGEVTLLWQAGEAAIAAEAGPEAAYVYFTEDGGLTWWEEGSFLPQPPDRDTVWDTLSVREEGDWLAMDRRARDTGETVTLWCPRQSVAYWSWTARVELEDLSALTPADLPEYPAFRYPESWDIDPVVRLWPDGVNEDSSGVAVFVCNEAVAGRRDMAVEVDGVLSWFDTGAGEWTLYGQQVWARPDWADLDGDGAEELTVTRSAGHGTGVSLTALHVLEPSGEGRYELSASFSLGDTERTQANAILAGLGLEGLSCGDLCDFPDPFTVELGVCDTAAGPQNYVGTLTCTLSYDGENLTMTDPAYAPSA